MDGEPIDALNAGVETFRNELVKDPIASRRVEIAVVTFDSDIKVVQPFVTANKFHPPTLTAQGFTCMGSAIHTALDLIDERKKLYKANGITYYRPWVLMMTDGEPHGEAEAIVEEAAERIKAEEEAHRVSFFAVGVQNASMERLSRIVVRKPLKLSGLNFQEMFMWLSTSMQRVSRSQVDEQLPLPPSSSTN